MDNFPPPDDISTSPENGDATPQRSTDDAPTTHDETPSDASGVAVAGQPTDTPTAGAANDAPSDAPTTHDEPASGGDPVETPRENHTRPPVLYGLDDSDDMDERLERLAADPFGPAWDDLDDEPVDHATRAYEPPPTGASGAPAGPGSAPAGTLRRLYRSTTSRRISGVAAGIAEYLGVSPVLIRLLFGLLVLTGIGVFAYPICWLLMSDPPAEYEHDPRQGRLLADRDSGLIAGAVVVALAIGIMAESWLVLAMSLIIGGAWLLSQQPGVDAPAPAHPAPTSTTAAPSAMPAATAAEPFVASPELPRAAAPAPLPAAQDPRPSRRSLRSRRRGPQPITRAALGALFLLAGLTIASGAGGWWDLSPGVTVGIGVGIVGLGVVAGAVRAGGARGLIPLGVLGVFLLIPIAFGSSILIDGVGERAWRPTTVAELPDSYELGAGVLNLDLSDLDLTGETVDLDIELGFGEIIITLPPDVGGTMELGADAGEIVQRLASPAGIEAPRPPWVNDETDLNGVSLDSGLIRLPGDQGELNLDVNVDFGRIEVRS